MIVLWILQYYGGHGQSENHNWLWLSYYLLSIYIINWFLLDFSQYQHNWRMKNVQKNFDEWLLILDISHIACVLMTRYESTHIFFEYFFINNHPTNQSITANENKISCKNIHQMLPYYFDTYISIFNYNTGRIHLPP